jgi:hypothetical protein
VFVQVFIRSFLKPFSNPSCIVQHILDPQRLRLSRATTVERSLLHHCFRSQLLVCHPFVRIRHRCLVVRELGLERRHGKKRLPFLCIYWDALD